MGTETAIRTKAQKELWDSSFLAPSYCFIGGERNEFRQPGFEGCERDWLDEFY
jgi:hypothetical protein